MTNKIKEDIPMPEALAMINESLTKIQQQINNLEHKVDGLNQKMHEGFAYHETWLNRIERNMATKTQFNTLIKFLERKDIISDYEVSHIIGSESGI